jgi:hypothetical protein
LLNNKNHCGECDSGCSENEECLDDICVSILAAPSNLIGNSTFNQINLTWTDNSENETGFKIERNREEIATVGAEISEYQDKGVDPSSLYSYRVRATNESGDSDYSNEINIVTAALPTPPEAPTIVNALAYTYDQINLTWIDNSDDEDGFRVQMLENDEDGSWITVAELPPNTEYFENKGLLSRNSYTYRINAYKISPSLNSYSNERTEFIPYVNYPCSALQHPTDFTVTFISSTQINFTWTDTNSHLEGIKYYLYQKIGGGMQHFLGDPFGYTQKLLYRDRESIHLGGLEPDTYYYFKLGGGFWRGLHDHCELGVILNPNIAEVTTLPE